MLPELTPAVTRVLETAQLHAGRLGLSEVLPIYLLHALLAEEEGRAWSLAVAAGLDAVAFRTSRPVPATPLPEPLSPLPLHPRALSSFYTARELAREVSGESIVASEALLLALVRADETLSAELESFGLSLAELERNILSQSQSPPNLEEPLRLPDVSERMDTARILDACANRAREGLRVIEDYCRFRAGRFVPEPHLERIAPRSDSGPGRVVSDLAPGGARRSTMLARNSRRRRSRNAHRREKWCRST